MAGHSPRATRRTTATLHVIAVVAAVMWSSAVIEAAAPILDASLVAVLSEEDVAVIEALEGAHGRQRTMASTSSSRSASAAAQGPPVLRLADVTLGDIFDNDVYRFVLRLRHGGEEGPGVCTQPELAALSAALCGDGDTAYDASCIKEEGTHFRALPYVVATFASMAELARVRQDFGHCISFFERDMAEHVVAAYTDDAGTSPLASAALSTATAQWNLDRIDQESWPLDRHFDTAGVDGTGVHIFIVDTGVWASHEDFGGRVGISHATFDGASTFDMHGHGTHCAGIAASSTYGVARNATVHSIKVLSDSGLGSSGDVIEALDYVINRKDEAPETPIVVSLSLGGGFSLSLNFAITEAMERNITVVTAAGNDGDDACLYSPSSSAAITVGSIDNTVNDRVSSFSNHGSCVDLYAPGGGILSTATGWNVVDGTSFSNVETSRQEGTSMAAPHVSGAAALFLQRHPRATPAQVKEAIMADAFAAGQQSSSDSGRLVLVIRDALLAEPEDLPPPMPVHADPFAADTEEPANGSVVPAPAEQDGGDTPEDYTCEVTEWTSWSACSASRPCTSGFRSRYRFVSNDIPLDLVLLRCPLLTAIETCTADAEGEACVGVGDPAASPFSGLVRDIVDRALATFS